MKLAQPSALRAFKHVDYRTALTCGRGILEEFAAIRVATAKTLAQ
jgi:hypothetical protein